MTPPFKLKYTNQHHEVTYLANLGGHWGPGDTRRLIERVTTKFENAKEFATVAEAHETLVVTDNVTNKMWQIVDADGNAVK